MSRQRIFYVVARNGKLAKPFSLSPVIRTKTACSASKMALEGAPCGPSMKTSSGGRFLECVVTGRGIEAAGSEVR